MSEQPRYHINVFWYPVERCWVADVPDLRPCSAKGDSPQAALAGAMSAMDAWIAAAKEAQLPVPEPCYCPALFAAA
jgi:predicted RNase H-like HicB family nuclease